MLWFSGPGTGPPDGPPAYPPACPFGGAVMVILYLPFTQGIEKFPCLSVIWTGLVFLLDSSKGWKVSTISTTGFPPSYWTLPLTETASGGLSLQPAASNPAAAANVNAHLPSIGTSPFFRARLGPEGELAE